MRKSAGVSVRARTLTGRTQVTVEDNGPGIPGDQREKVFQPLFSTRAFGVGLGLPIARKIMREHGGDIRVRSAPAEGTEVEVRLPGVAVAEPLEVAR